MSDHLLSKAVKEIRELEDARILMEVFPPEEIRQFMGDFIRRREADVSVAERIEILQMIIKDSFPQYQEILDEFLVLI